MLNKTVNLVLKKEDYLDGWEKYLEEYVRGFFGLSITRDNMEEVFRRSEETENERYKYPLYFLWIYSKDIRDWYKETGKETFVEESMKRMYKAKCNPKYNDYWMLRMYRMLDIEYSIEEKVKKRMKERDFMSDIGFSEKEWESFYKQAVSRLVIKHKLRTKDKSIVNV